MTAAVITSIGEEKKKKSLSIPGVSHGQGLCGQTVGVGFSDSRVDVRGFKYSGIFPSPYSLLSLSHPSAHPPLDLPVVPNRGRKRGWEGRDVLEVKRSMWASLPGQNRSVGRVTSSSVDVVIAADTVTRHSPSLRSEQFIKQLFNHWLLKMSLAATKEANKLPAASLFYSRACGFHLSFPSPLAVAAAAADEPTPRRRRGS